MCSKYGACMYVSLYVWEDGCTICMCVHVSVNVCVYDTVTSMTTIEIRIYIYIKIYQFVVVILFYVCAFSTILWPCFDHSCVIVFRTIPSCAWWTPLTMRGNSLPNARTWSTRSTWTCFHSRMPRWVWSCDWWVGSCDWSMESCDIVCYGSNDVERLSLNTIYLEVQFFLFVFCCFFVFFLFCFFVFPLAFELLVIVWLFFSILQCLKFYCGRWHKVDHSFNQSTTKYTHLLQWVATWEVVGVVYVMVGVVTWWIRLIWL